MDGGMAAKKIHNSIRQKGFFIGAAAGSGNQARWFCRYGVDFIIASSSSRVRQMGSVPIAGFLPYGNSNELVMEYAERELLPGKFQVPIVFGLCATDPMIEMRGYLEELKRLGFSGIINSPSVGIFEGEFRRALEEAGISYDMEVEAIKIAHELGLFTLAVVYEEKQAEKMQEAGADVLCVQGGKWGTDYEDRNTILAKEIGNIKEAGELRRNLNIRGFIGESCFEKAIQDGSGGKSLRDLILESEEAVPGKQMMQGKKDYVQYVKWYVSRNYKNHLCFNDIAKEMSISRSYLSSIFNQEVGCSFQEYISNYRIKKAIALMNQKNIPLCALAEMVGYEDYAHFSKVFKKKMGVCPTKYAG